MVTFAEARALVQRMLVGEPATVSAHGWEDDRVYRVLVHWTGGYEFDAPTIVVDKATGHIEQLPWTEGVTGRYDPGRMRPVSL